MAFNLQSGLLFSLLVLYRNEMLLGLEELTPKKVSATLMDLDPNCAPRVRVGKGAFHPRFFFRVPSPRGLTPGMSCGKTGILCHSKGDQVCLHTTASLFYHGFVQGVFYMHSWNPIDMMILHSQTGTAHVRSNNKKRAAVSERKASSCTDWIGSSHTAIPHLYNDYRKLYITAQYLMYIRYYPIIHKHHAPKESCLKETNRHKKRSNQPTNQSIVGGPSPSSMSSIVQPLVDPPRSDSQILQLLRGFISDLPFSKKQSFQENGECIIGSNNVKSRFQISE